MPWSASDATKHTKAADSAAKKKRWATIANSVLASCLREGGSQKVCEGRAVRIANSRMGEVSEGMGKSHRQKRYGSVTSTGVRIQEFIGVGNELKVDKESGVIRGVRILNRQSRNNRSYTDRALTDIAELLDGKHAFADHGEKNDRSIREVLGIWVNARADQSGGKVVADLKVRPGEEWLLETAEKLPEAIRMSIDARGLVTRRDGRELVNRIAELNSVDAVTEGGTTRGIFESEEGGKGDMDINGLADLKDQHAGLLEEFRQEVEDELKAGSETEAKLVSLEAEGKALKEKLTKAETRTDELETEKKAGERKVAVEAALAEAKLPDYAVSDGWRKTIEALEGDELKAAIEDRRTLIEKAGGRTPVSQERQGSNEEMKGEELKEALTS